jgi:hypothetical protein
LRVGVNVSGARHHRHRAHAGQYGHCHLTSKD